MVAAVTRMLTEVLIQDTLFFFFFFLIPRYVRFHAQLYFYIPHFIERLLHGKLQCDLHGKAPRRFVLCFEKSLSPNTTFSIALGIAVNMQYNLLKQKELKNNPYRIHSLQLRRCRSG